MIPENTTRLGHFLGPHGLRGGVKLFVIGEPEQVLRLPRVYVENWGWMKINRTEALFPGVVLHLAGIGNKDAAADLRGLNVYAHDNDLPALEEGSFYYHQLRDLPVFHLGKQIGTVEEVSDTGHQDLLHIDCDGVSSLVPLQAPYVLLPMENGVPVRVDLTEDTPEGLLATPEAEEL